MLVVFIIFSSCGENNSNTKAKSKTDIEKWYLGGTLHKATISDWKSSTPENRLATCGDFMASIDNSVSMDVLKQRATKLMDCINESTEGLDNTNNESVSSIASKCIVLLGYR